MTRAVRLLPCLLVLPLAGIGCSCDPGTAETDASAAEGDDGGDPGGPGDDGGLLDAALPGDAGDTPDASACASCDAGSTPSDGGLDAGDDEDAGEDEDAGDSDDAGPEEPPPACSDDNDGPGALPNGTVPGALSFPYPTLRHVTILWEIEGDEDDDGVVSVRFREAGTSAWRRALPLFRAVAGSSGDFSWGDRHSGSLFGLEPDTLYEVELFLLDPDGGCEVRVETVRTRPVPAPMPGATVVEATPGTLASVLSNAEPGDIVELAGGTYPSFHLQQSGAEGAPLVLRAKAGETATIDGDLTLTYREYVHVDGLVVNGRIRMNYTVGVAITNNLVNAVGQTGNGINFPLRSEDNYIADNVVLGQTGWQESALGVNGDNLGEGILTSGPGHVVEHNYVAGFRDCLSTQEPGAQGEDHYSIDFLHNEVRDCADDGIEADYCEHNCRVIGNRFTNVFMMASAQPSYGGPTYFIRNAGYNVLGSAFKLHNSTVGDVILHNTVVRHGDAFAVNTDAVFERTLTRNNLFLGGQGGSYGGYNTGNGRVLSVQSAGATVDFDYDAFGSATGTFTGRFRGVSFNGLEEMRTMTTEAHAIEVDYEVFAATIAYPSPPFPPKDASDLRPAAGSAVVDVGVALPNVNDGYLGSAPDLGAYEQGAPLPAYGPRDDP